MCRSAMKYPVHAYSYLLKRIDRKKSCLKFWDNTIFLRAGRRRVCSPFMSLVCPHGIV